MDYKQVNLLYSQLSALLECCNSDLDAVNMLQIELLSEALNLDSFLSVPGLNIPCNSTNNIEKINPRAVERLEVFSVSESIGLNFYESENNYELNDYDLEYANYVSANSELNEMSNHINESVSDIKLRFETLINEVNNSHGIRQDICHRVFNDDALRFGKFTRARKKLQFMDKAERRAFDLLAFDLEIDEMELLDRIEHEYNKKEKTARIRDLKRYRDYAVSESIAYDERMSFLQDIVNNFETRYNWIDELELFVA